ncbi:hypothetical protein CIP107538_02402 [Corynebacterium diphtheriae]|nr:hypothetical protein CIP107538_02402 [Corynebacterium diphtheriae]CAB0919006.1 hypothetical protein FRC0414_02147 [Corynebacterium diphtheriae]
MAVSEIKVSPAASPAVGKEVNAVSKRATGNRGERFMIKVVFDHVVDLEDSGAAGDQATGGTGIDNAGGAVATEVGVGKRPAQGDGGVERSNAGDQGRNTGGHAACFFGGGDHDEGEAVAYVHSPYCGTPWWRRCE